MNAREFQRGRLRTIIANADAGKWIVQSGDQVLVPHELITECDRLRAGRASHDPVETIGHAAHGREGQLLVLSKASGHCVCLNESEIEHLSA